MGTREEMGWLKSLALFHHLSESKLEDLARYLNVPPELTPQLLDAACATYFVKTKKT